MLAALKKVYQESRKKEDIAWNTYVARPQAAILVYILARTPLTPNQVSFLGGALFIAAAFVLAIFQGPWGFLAAALLIHVSYLFDCADGQLARLKAMTSEVGAYLDFFIDEIKALLLVGAAGLRLYLLDGEVYWLFLTIGAVFVVSTATSLTNFIRRPEYAGRVIGPGESAKKREMPGTFLGKVIWLVEGVARYFIHYPSWILWVALLAILVPLDGALIFLVPFLGVYLLYFLRTGSQVLFKLGAPGFYRQ